MPVRPLLRTPYLYTPYYLHTSIRATPPHTSSLVVMSSVHQSQGILRLIIH